MSAVFHDPWHDFDEISRAIDAMVDAFLARLAGPDRPAIAFVPPCDVARTKHEFLFRLAVPGVLEEDIDLTIEGRRLTVRGEREHPFAATGEFMNREIRDGYFERSFSLPFAIDPQRVKVELSEGVLFMRVERPESA
jgi:HSP20 family protein